MSMTQDQHNAVTDHGTIIVDADHHFNIDVETRAITNSENKKTSLIQYDHNSERFSFDIARTIEGHDILLCNRVQIHYVTAAGSGRSKHIGVYDVTDLQVHPTDDTKACFSWLISENATHYDGKLSFLITFACTKDDETLYRWSSAICNTIIIVPGMNNSNAVVENYPDTLLQWEFYLKSLADDTVDELKNTTIPNLVDECYVEKVFATPAEVAAVFGLEVNDIEEVTTSAEMDTLLAAANVGKTYHYTGTTDDKYINGDLYRVEETDE